MERFTVTVEPGSAGDGAFHVAARISDAFGAQEAVAQVLRGEIAEGANVLGVELTQDQVRVLPGQHGTLEVTLTNPTGSEIRGEAQLISPFGSWHLASEPIQGFAIPAGGEQVVTFDIAADGPGKRPGEWWASVKVMYFGRVHFTPAIPLVVTTDPLSVSVGAFAIGVGGTEEVAVEVLNIGTEPLSGELSLEVPDGWTAEPSPQAFGPVGPGETLIVPVQVTAPADTEPGSFTLAATATAGGSTASSKVTARILPDRIQFAPGTPDEAYWMLDPGASITQTGLRFADNDRYWIYRFALPVETTAAMLTVKLDNQYLVEVRADEGEWVELLRETKEIRDGSNSGDFEADLTEHLGEQRILDLRFSDSFPKDCWGVRLFDLVLVIVR
ncbi:NEW3 domain-containing protein [Brachybacterium epidermidis]|uniref:COG1470 family protein n=1 Tax=Brachybacterium epidermidis TaxID=2781983 RepID=UPI00398F780E